MSKKKEKIVSPEELEIQRLALEESINCIEKSLELIPEPTYIFEVGSPIRIGNTQDIKIERVLFDGRAYEISYTTYEPNQLSWRLVKKENQKRIVLWTEVRKKIDVIPEQMTKDLDLHLDFSQIFLQGIIDKAYYNGVDLSPSYQIDFIWSLDEKVKLIDSIFNGFGIGEFVFVRLESENQGMFEYEILDGKERMKTILEFYEDRFSYKGMLYSDLCDNDQGSFIFYSTRFAVLSGISEEQKLRYFLKLNGYGSKINQESLEKVRQRLIN
ncbi:hypothetical protein QFZ81_001009 [Paenibacillus sp. V4I9]|uniref:DUF262 domain-containing protein n=1 Tax=Paenibacillus sp. V4I9 TaxID=3042308 RepID=UPI0027842C17|nr:DUF262 domain-containing protein [Paenibacillus sp. V4I9]MDQ0885921.1 hypothetical protein [Paenibacillus sp. V4I9]